jgi:hypothetical protein
MHLYESEKIRLMCEYIECDRKIAAYVKCTVADVATIRATIRKRKRGRPPQTAFTIATKSGISDNAATSAEMKMAMEFKMGCDNLLKAQMLSRQAHYDADTCKMVCELKGWL